jgi:polar amino acid transport system permease protein
MTHTTTDTTTERARPEPIKAVPVRHPWRWVGTAVIVVLVAMFIHMLVTNSNFQWKFIFVSSGAGQRGAMFTPPVLNGLRGTLLLTLFSMLIGVGLGVVLAIMRLSPSPVLRWSAFGYVWFFRAVPRLVLAVLFGNLGILWSRFGIGLPFDQQIGDIFGVHDLSAKIYSVRAVDLLTGFVAGMLALGLSEAAYMAEIVRAGIVSIDPGQEEAASALGLSRGQTLSRIVLPQAMRVIVPPTGNETIAMVKDTSLVAFTPVAFELFFQMRAIAARTFQVFPVLVGAVIWYLIICTVLMIIQYYVERHFSRGYGQPGRRGRIREIDVEHTGQVEVVPDPGTEGGARA